MTGRDCTDRRENVSHSDGAPKTFRQISITILVASLGVLVPLAAVLALVAASARIAEIADPGWRALAIAAEVVLGVLWLLGAVYVATHFAVIVFAKPRSSE
jgi:membrane protein YdbS with pleckstrin-like domain